MQKELEKLRRQHAREEKQRQVEQKHKERAQRAKERSNQVFLKVNTSYHAGIHGPLASNGLGPSYFGGFATYHKTFFWPVYMIKYIMFNTKNEKLDGYEVGSREHRILNFEVPKMWDRI